MLKLLRIKAAHPSHLKNLRFYKSQNGYFGFQPKQKIEKNQHAKLQNAIDFFRRNGYKYANITPFSERDNSILNDLIDSEIFERGDEAKYLLQHLKSSYSGEIAFEIEHIESHIEKDWLYEVAESNYKDKIPAERQRRIFQVLMKSQVFENFLGKKFPTLKRYSGEGCESMLAFFDELILACSEKEVEDILLSIPHRGRLSLLTGLLEFPHSQLFYKIKGNPEFESSFKFTGDVISHLTSSINIKNHGTDLHITMLPNPSHLEASHPVVMGKTRSRQLTKKYGDYGSMENQNKVLSVLVHGDAAMAGQGIVMESVCLSRLPNFDIGGSIHLVVNNHVGFTTPYDRGSSMSHCSDVVKMIGAPVIHVNGDFPEDVAKSAKIALNYKNRFRKDVIVNMHCYRKWGHNEIDDPTLTNPGMYKLINSRSSVPELYAKNLLSQGVLNETDVKLLIDSEEIFLNEQLSKADQFVAHWSPFKGNWKNMTQAHHEYTTVWNTGVDINLLKFIASKSVEAPPTFAIHPNLEKSFCKARVSKMEDGSAIDWATAEALAVGSLIMEGNHVRISGQDVGRGTFSHRHFMFVDQQTDDVHIPLNNLSKEQTGFLEVVNSPLSEEAVLAYEYGISIENPKHLVLWEAQFGDFFNGAQIIIDTFISSGELKWLLQSGLVLLLPHGMDGAGPDHSSCKLERFLQLSDSSEDIVDSDNTSMQIVNPTTPAQYFHLLRRQQVRNFRKPLIVASPKLILRMSAATSSIDEMREGTYFKPVIGDTVPPASVVKVVFCSGKHFYELAKERSRLKIQNVALVRIESLVPFPAEEIKEIMRSYSNAKEFVWSQEEHRNQGAWSFVYPRFENLIRIKLRYCGRPVLGASSVGISKRHADECKTLFDGVFSS
ncbi:2-oxoadipate dehydrogenase complex component E1 isoform X1 [Hydra vulgaris]|uniref:2-oxoadipate dehydrogenase complex component E1 isoform X1 n=1 Tax=Hydra vulgaris TaxID=6087 RepID=UPI001F5E5B5A|nr:probable 2-oxoglutarate dehydrogenase E1 component DHKTD1, mitochondrial isoform X1 [Hydra vulgaris]